MRYQYVVQNLRTGDIKKFGINHFQEHTGISPQVVKDIILGIEKIDYELDEILVKVAAGWSLVKKGLNEIPSDYELPKEIKDHLSLNLPLLDRQFSRLTNLIREFLKEIIPQQESPRSNDIRQTSINIKTIRQERKALDQDYQKFLESYGTAIEQIIWETTDSTISILDEQEIEEISRKLGESLTEYVQISISLYRQGFIEEVSGIVQKIDPGSREITLTDYEEERHKIIFDNIVNVEVH